MWELTLGIVVFTYLVAFLRRGWARTALFLAFLSYALLDLWRLVAFVIFGREALVGRSFVWADPALYLPIVMFVTLALYVFMVRRSFYGVTHLVRSYGT